MIVLAGKETKTMTHRQILRAVRRGVHPVQIMLTAGITAAALLEVITGGPVDVPGKWQDWAVIQRTSLGVPTLDGETT